MATRRHFRWADNTAARPSRSPLCLETTATRSPRRCSLRLTNPVQSCAKRLATTLQVSFASSSLPCPPAPPSLPTNPIPQPGVHWTAGDVGYDKDAFPYYERHGGYSGFGFHDIVKHDTHPTVYKPTIQWGMGRLVEPRRVLDSSHQSTTGTGLWKATRRASLKRSRPLESLRDYEIDNQHIAGLIAQGNRAIGVPPDFCLPACPSWSPLCSYRRTYIAQRICVSTAWMHTHTCKCVMHVHACMHACIMHARIHSYVHTRLSICCLQHSAIRLLQRVPCVCCVTPPPTLGRRNSSNRA